MITECQINMPDWNDLVRNTIYYSTTNHGFYIALGKYVSANTFLLGYHATCRDDILYEVRKRVRKSGFSKAENLQKMAFGFISYNCSTKPLKTRMLRAQKMLNDIEKQLRWKRTKFYFFDSIRVNNKRAKAGYTIKKIGRGTKYETLAIAAMEGSKCWVQNPFFVHILLGIVKQCFHLNKEIKENEAMEEFLTRLAKGRVSGGPRGSGYSSAHLWVKLLKERRKVFGPFEKADLYKQNRQKYSTVYALGVNNLVELTSSINVVNAEGYKLAESMKKWRKSLSKRG